MKESRKKGWDALRADPHDARPGTSKAIPLQTGTKKTITVELPVLRLIVIDASGAPYVDKAYTLEGASADKKTGTTQAGTPITQKMMGKGTVQLSLELPAAAAAAAAPASGPPGAPPPAPAYPLPIQAGDFTDDVVKPDDVTVRWQLTAIAGELFDQDPTQAELVRLHNLGFHLPRPDPNAPETQASVRAFQRKYGLTPTGAIADVQQRLLDEHDKP